MTAQHDGFLISQELADLYQTIYNEITSIEGGIFFDTLCIALSYNGKEIGQPYILIDDRAFQGPYSIINQQEWDEFKERWL